MSDLPESARREHQTQVLDLRGYEDARSGPGSSARSSAQAETQAGGQQGTQPWAAQGAQPQQGAPAWEEVTAQDLYYPAPTGPRGLGGPVGLVLAFLVSGGLCWALAAPPTVVGAGGEVVDSLLSTTSPRGLGHWWSVALPLVVAAWAWAASTRAGATRRFGRAAGWAWTGFALVAVSAVTALDLPGVLRDRIALSASLTDQLPAWVTDNPVESVLTLVLVLGFLVLLAACRAEQKLLLVVAVLCVGFACGLGRDVMSLPVAPEYTGVASVGFGWLGLLSLMLAATLERRA